VKILSVGKYFPKTVKKKGKFGVKCSKYLQICPKKVILSQNHGILAKCAKMLNQVGLILLGIF